MTATRMTALHDEARRELADAVFVAADATDVALLDRLDLRAALHVPHGNLLGYVVGCEARHVVLLGGTDPRIAPWLGIELPDVEVRTLAIDSPLLALGVRAMPTTIDECDRLRERWLDLAADHARLADVSAVLTAAPTTTVRRAAR